MSFCVTSRLFFLLSSCFFLRRNNSVYTLSADRLVKHSKQTDGFNDNSGMIPELLSKSKSLPCNNSLDYQGGEQVLFHSAHTHTDT